MYMMMWSYPAETRSPNSWGMLANQVPWDGREDLYLQIVSPFENSWEEANRALCMYKAGFFSTKFVDPNPVFFKHSPKKRQGVNQDMSNQNLVTW